MKIERKIKMEQKPSLSDFIWNNIVWFKKYFVYTNKETGKMYKELNAKKTGKYFCMHYAYHL